MMSSEDRRELSAREALLANDHEPTNDWKSSFSVKARRRITFKAVIIHGIIFAFSITCGLLTAVWPHSSFCGADTLLSISPEHVFEVPVFEGGASDFKPVRFQGTPDTMNLFKGPPSPEVDKAWKSLWTQNMIIPAEHYAKTRPQFPEAGVAAANRRDNAYFATFEATHQLHCLYNLFRASYADYYETERYDWMHDPVVYHARLDHCIDILRQKLMCDADAGVVTYNWVKGTSRPVANYNVMHQCRSHDQLLEYSKQFAATGAVFNSSLSQAELETDP